MCEARSHYVYCPGIEPSRVEEREWSIKGFFNQLVELIDLALKAFEPVVTYMMTALASNVARALILQRNGRYPGLRSGMRAFATKGDDGSSEDGKQPGLMSTIFG